MSKWEWGYLYWSIWIFGLFLVPELLGFFGVAPWPTLSSTAWHAEKHWPILYTFVTALLFGLFLHFIYHWRLTTAFGVALGYAVLFTLWKVIP